jgi:hypothetical protein
MRENGHTLSIESQSHSEQMQNGDAKSVETNFESRMEWPRVLTDCTLQQCLSGYSAVKIASLRIYLTSVPLKRIKFCKVTQSHLYFNELGNHFVRRPLLGSDRGISYKAVGKECL